MPPTRFGHISTSSVQPNAAAQLSSRPHDQQRNRGAALARQQGAEQKQALVAAAHRQGGRADPARASGDAGAARSGRWPTACSSRSRWAFPNGSCPTSDSLHLDWRDLLSAVHTVMIGSSKTIMSSGAYDDRERQLWPAYSRPTLSAVRGFRRMPCSRCSSPAGAGLRAECPQTQRSCNCHCVSSTHACWAFTGPLPRLAEVVRDGGGSRSFTEEETHAACKGRRQATRSTPASAWPRRKGTFGARPCGKAAHISCCSTGGYVFRGVHVWPPSGDIRSASDRTTSTSG